MQETPETPEPGLKLIDFAFSLDVLHFRIALSSMIYKQLVFIKIARFPAFPAIRITPSGLTSHIMANTISSSLRKCMAIQFVVSVGTPYIDYTGMCGLGKWICRGKKYVEMGNF